MRKRNIIVALAACAFLSAAVYAQQKGRVKPLTALDYAEIQQLYVRYNWAIDNGAEQGMAWAKTFTQDGEAFLGPNNTMAGWEQLAQFARKVSSGAKAPHHFVTNIRIEPAAEGARGGGYFFNVPTPEPNKPAGITATGTYDDVIVRTADGWRFKQRKFYPNALPPAAGSSN